jgi:nitronate monooxygenase
MTLGKKMPQLRIADLVARVPIVQGGMGVGISMSGLAAAVANEGGIGVISATGIGMLEPDFNTNFAEANKRALLREISAARKLTDGIVGVNIMVALTDYHELLQTAVEGGADIVFMGAGLPLRISPSVLGELGKPRTKIGVIVSSGRAARVIFQYWKKNFGRVPDVVVVEGPLAGGHLGFKKEQIDDPEYRLEKILPEVISEVAACCQESNAGIPVIAGGGVFTGEDIFRLIEMGANGVQMATRFVATHECDASIEFKRAYVNCRKEDLRIIVSPVGLPGRAIQNQFLSDVSSGKKVPYECHWHCLKTCDFVRSPYCICAALTNARKGNLDKGFVFAGANAYRVSSIVSVKELIAELAREYQEVSVEGAPNGVLRKSS